MRRTARLRLALPAVTLGLLVGLTGCGEQGPTDEELRQSLDQGTGAVPADLCAAIDESTRAGLETSTTSVADGNPTATCALVSPVDVKPVVAATISLIVYGDTDAARESFESQCALVDTALYTVTPSIAVAGAEEGCANEPQSNPASGATLNALVGRQVVVTRLTSKPPGDTSSLKRAQGIVETLLASLEAGTEAVPPSTDTSPGAPEPTPSAPEPDLAPQTS